MVQLGFGRRRSCAAGDVRHATYLAFTSKLVPRAEIPPKGSDEKGSEQGLNRNEGAGLTASYMGPFLGPLGIPCQAPPWGYVAAADLRTGKIAYKHVNGTVL